VSTTTARWFAVGWCHSCGTHQLLQDAPWLPNPYTGDHELVPCCIVCREVEPWGLGVWDMERQCARGEPVPGKWGVFAVHTCAQLHAQRQDEMWAFDCDCPITEVQRFPVVHTHCTDCDERSEARVIGFTPSGGHDWETDRGRPCEHWQEHYEAASRAARNPSGRGGRGPVRGEVVFWR
jgi:hypothetical protein